MDSLELSERLQGRVSRRTVVKTGVKLAYAAPLVAASFKLSAGGALAAACPAGYEPVDKGPTGRPDCCRCACTTSDAILTTDDTGAANCVDAVYPDEGYYPECLECIGIIQSLP